MAEGPVSGFGRGGMASKIAAAKIATGAGCDVIIAKGHVMHPLARDCRVRAHTVFRASITPAAARKRWIAGVLKPQGTLIDRRRRGTGAA